MMECVRIARVIKLGEKQSGTRESGMGLIQGKDSGMRQNPCLGWLAPDLRDQIK